MKADLLLLNIMVSDPNFGDKSINAFQHNDGTYGEQWADIWANYVAGNINLEEGAGKELYLWIINQLSR